MVLRVRSVLPDPLVRKVLPEQPVRPVLRGLPELFLLLPIITH